MSAYSAIPAQAQQQPWRDQSGFSLGAFQVRPNVEVQNTYNDNIFATENGEVGDYIVSTVPGVEIESGWSRHFLSVSGIGRIHRHAHQTVEDNEEFLIDATGRLDLRDTSSLGASVGGGRRTVGRANAENSRRTQPQQLNFLAGDLRFDHRFGPLDLALLGSVNRLDFRESADSDRDRIGFGGRAKLSYRFSPAFSVFLEPVAEVLDYDERMDDSGFERNSLALEGYVGSRIDIASILAAEFSLGAIHVNFDEPSFDDVTTLGARGELTWDVTRLTRLEGEVTRGLSPTTQGGASSKVETQASFGVRHELRRNVQLSAKMRYRREKFRGLGRIDDDYRFRAGAEYLINPFLALDLEYSYRIRNSNFPTEGFRSNIIVLTLELQM